MGDAFSVPFILSCLFSMRNWKWVNLSAMAGFNISLNERQSSSDKKYKNSLRLVLFIAFRCCFAGSLPFSLSRVKKKKTKLFHSISEMFFTFLARITLWVKLFSLNVCEALLQAAIKGGNFGAKLTHLCGFWLDASFFSHVKKHRSRLWLARTNFGTKIYDIAFWWVFLSVYIIKVGTWRCLDNKISGWQQTRNVS